MSLRILKGDITKLKVDAIVNPANRELLQGGGVCGAIFKEAGPRDLQRACDLLSPIEVGEAVITPGFKLPASYVIHTVGPIYRGGKEGEAELLARAYRSSLELAYEKKLESIAFPLISSGIFGYPKEEALAVGVETIKAFLEERELDVTLVIFSKNDIKLSGELLTLVEDYLDKTLL